MKSAVALYERINAIRSSINMENLVKLHKMAIFVYADLLTAIVVKAQTCINTN